jgi:hypothetical protein
LEQLVEGLQDSTHREAERQGGGLPSSRLG